MLQVDPNFKGLEIDKGWKLKALGEKNKPGFTKSDKPKSIAFNSEFSSLEVYRKF